MQCEKVVKEFIKPSILKSSTTKKIYVGPAGSNKYS